MKHILTIAVAVTGLALPASAETLNIVKGDVTYIYSAEKMGKAVFDGSGNFILSGMEFKTSEIDRMFVRTATGESNLVSILYDGDKTSVNVSGDIARYVDVTVQGCHVSIIQSAETGESTGEITYSLSGSSEDGSLTLEGSYKSTVVLNGLNLTSTTGAPLNIQNGKRIALKVNEGTVNTLSDAPGGSQKGAIVCKGHLEIKGKGELNVTGRSAHAIQAKEYVEMKNATVNILGSVKDGINCTQYFLLESGKLTVMGIGDDAVQTDFKDTADREAEDTGSITISGGTFKATVTNPASKGLKAEGDILVNGGKIEISTSGKGIWDSAKSKTKASSCLSADGDITVNAGDLNLSSSGSGGKGMSCDGTCKIIDGQITINTTGGIFAYVNGIEYDGYTGNTDRISSDLKSSPKGIKADKYIEIAGGDINVKTTGKGAEGIESKGELTLGGGTVYVYAYDDAINSASHMNINGGDITVIATNNDGLDSNGNMYFNGGVVRAFGASSPECGIDANEEEGYSVFFKGGIVLGVGGNNSVPSKTESTQCYVSGSGSAVANTVISLKDGNDILAEFTVPAEYKASSQSSGWRPGGSGSSKILISCPGLTNGQKYTLLNGTASSSVTATQKGSGTGGRPW